jgi:4-hydroxy-tetrahydrodipicolinate reductase
MKRINISIVGANGKMGATLIEKINKNRRFKLCSLTDLDATKKIAGLVIQKNNLDAFKKTEIIIDFSKPKSTIKVLKIAKILKKKNNHRDYWIQQKSGKFNKELFKKNLHI